MAKRSSGVGVRPIADGRAVGRGGRAIPRGGLPANALWLKRYAKPGEAMPSAEELGKRQEAYKRHLKELWRRYDKCTDEQQRDDLRLLIQGQTLKVYIGG